jgi:hypothetical protein
VFFLAGDGVSFGGGGMGRKEQDTTKQKPVRRSLGEGGSDMMMSRSDTFVVHCGIVHWPLPILIPRAKTGPFVRYLCWE